MKWVMLIVMGVFLFGFVGAEDSSSTKTAFNIKGCTFDFDGGEIGVAAGKCSRGDAYGYFYCDEDKGPWITTEEGFGCSRGKTSYTLGDKFCCPAGMFCNETDSGRFICSRRTENCFDMATESECNGIGCTWLEIEGVCADGTRDYSCEYYDTQESCETDDWGLGQMGLGTDVCGTTIECVGMTFSIPEGDCGCKWYDDAPEGKKCQISLIGVQMFYDPSKSYSKFSCSNTYELEECIDGDQNVTWFSESSVIGGFGSSPSSVPEECLEAVGCNGGSDVRACGEPIIKLPGFSLFALIVSFGVIGLCYFYGKIAKELNRTDC